MMLPEALVVARQRGASDVVAREKFGVYFKVDGRNTDVLYAPQPASITDFLRSFDIDVNALEPKRRVWGFGLEHADFGRIRAQLAHDKLGLSLTARLIPSAPFPLDFFGFPRDVIESLSRAPRGLIIITGGTGSGKSSLWQSLSANVYSPQQRDQVILEDPCELLFNDRLIQQFEVGDHPLADVVSFAEGGRHSLRANSMVVILGEIRDTETARAALQLAESGALVIVTLHTPRTIDTPERLLAFFDGEERALARTQLAQTLYAVVGPRLARLREPLDDGRRRVMIVEYLPGDDDVRHAILQGDTKTMKDYLLGPPRRAQERDVQRPHLLEDAIADLLLHERITDDEAEALANDVTVAFDRRGAAA